jgi:hypothetical protein
MTSSAIPATATATIAYILAGRRPDLEAPPLLVDQYLDSDGLGIRYRSIRPRRYAIEGKLTAQMPRSSS